MQSQAMRSAHALGPSHATHSSTFRCSRLFASSRVHPRSHASSATIVAATAAQQLPELKQELQSIIQAAPSTTALPPEAVPLLEQINAAAQEAGLPEITPDGIRGKFRQLLSTTNFVDAEGCVALGVLTFNQFQPKDLKLKLLGVELLQGIESPDQYSTEATFEILDGELKGVQGVQKTLGRYVVSSEKRGRQDVYFSGVALFPKHEADRGAWVAALQAQNPTMDAETGRAVVEFPGQAAHGFRDFLLLGDDLTLTVGNRKSFVAVTAA